MAQEFEQAVEFPFKRTRGRITGRNILHMTCSLRGKAQQQ